MEEHNIDKFIREKLHNHSAAPSDKVWKGINEALDKREKDRGFFNVSRLGLILILLFFAGSSGYLMYRVHKLDKAVQLTDSERKESKKSTLPGHTPVLESDSLNEEAQNKEVSGHGSGPEAKMEEAQSNPAPFPSDIEKSRPVDAPSENIERAENKGEDQNAMPLAGNRWSEKDNPDGEVGVEMNFPKGLDTDTDLQPNTDSSLADMPIVLTGNISAETANQSHDTAYQSHDFNAENAGMKGAANPPYEGLNLDLIPMEALGISLAYFGPVPDFPEQTQDYYNLPTHRFTLGAYGIVSSNYRRVNARNGSEELVSRLNKAEKTLVNYGGGLSLGYDLSEHWRIGVGIEYRVRVQEGAYPVILEFENVEFDNASPSGELGWAYTENLESSYGEADFEIVDHGHPYGEIGLSTPPAEYRTQVGIIRTQQILHIPLGLEYCLNAGSWRFLTGAGLAWDRVLSDRTVLSATEFENISFSAPVTTVGNYFSYHLGLAVEYSLTERLSIRINPRYESWLTPVFQNDNLRTLPYSLSIAAGVGIRL